MILEAGTRRAFLERYRDLSGWRSLPSGDPTRMMDLLLGSVEDLRFPGALLPRTGAHRLSYYAVASTHSAWRSLAPLLTAFAGVTATDFDGSLPRFSPEDELERFLATQGFAAVRRIGTMGDARAGLVALRALVRARTMLDQAPVVVRADLRPTHELLAEHRWALVAGDRTRAAETIDFVRRNMRLDALNLRFMEVKTSAVFGDWFAIRARPDFDELCVARRPIAVTRALVTALYKSSLEKAGPEADGYEAAFQETCRPYSETLLRSLPPDADGTVVLTVALACCGRRPHDAATIEALAARISALDPSVESAAAEALLSRSSAAVGVAAAWSPDAVMAALAERPKPSVQEARSLLAAAAALQTLASQRTLADALATLTSTELEAVLNTPGLRTLWRELLPAATPPAPRNWIEWLDGLDDAGMERSASLAEEGAQQWPVAEHLGTAADVEALVAALDRTRSSNAEEQLLVALPSIVAWLVGDARWPRTLFAPLYRQLLTLVLLQDRRSSPIFSALTLLFEGLLRAGMDRATYADAIGTFAGALGHDLGTAATDWLLDLAELTVVHPCHDPVARSSFWDYVLAECIAVASRLGALRWSVLEDLAGILGGRDVVVEMRKGVVEAAPSGEAGSRAQEPVDLAGKTIAIYTLTEAVAVRAAERLCASFPGVKVEVCHDHGGSERLRAAARHADLFVVCWLSAKHAATEFIQANRPAGLDTVFPTGRGATSILRAVHAHFAL